jgi:hypothetical protein
MGTGAIMGRDDGASVSPKENGIGSKNLGLRSLFLFGDRIHVRSNGRMSVLDMPKAGTASVADAETKGQRGVQIVVPFRHKSTGKLPAFDIEEETRAFESFSGALFGTLCKLALPGTVKGIRRLTITSERLGRRLTWNQTAKAERSSLKGVSTIVRAGKLVEQRGAGPGDITSTSFAEREYVRSVSVSTIAPPISFPRYYRAPKGGLRLAVSLPIRRRKVDLDQLGYFHYPLRAPGGLTGMTLSSSAPFQMNADRSEIVDNAWNRWLAAQVAEFASYLLTADWIDRFGSDVFLAVGKNGASTKNWFVEAILMELKQSSCWPTEITGVLKKASELVVATQPELRGFLSRDLRKDLGARDGIVALAQASGAKPFGIHSLIRLKCAGKEGGALATKVPVEQANFYFGDFTEQLSRVERQVQFAEALSSVTKNLSPQNRSDLRKSLSTLAADGALRAAEALYVVADEIWDGCPIPMSSRLHQSLRSFRVITGLCNPFDVQKWIIEVSARALEDSVTEVELNALYSMMISAPEKIGRAASSAIRASPVLKNSVGEWEAAKDLAVLPPDVQRTMAGVLNAPAKEVVANDALMAKLSIRRRLLARDLIALAEAVVDNGETSARCEDLLARNLKLLSPANVKALRNVAFLRSKSGAIGTPDQLHLNLPINTLILGSPDHIVGGTHTSLYKLLKCRPQPSFEALMALLRTCRDQDVSPKEPQIFYTALATAVTIEKKSLAQLAQEPILWVGKAYCSPSGTLVGSAIPSNFDTALPVVRDRPPLERAYADLGAARYANDGHWVSFFEWFDQRGDDDPPLRAVELKALKRAYWLRGTQGFPSDLGDDANCLLTRDRKLLSLNDVLKGRLIEDDYPDLASAISAAGIDVSFADTGDDAGAFFDAVQIKRLSEICGIPRVTASEVAEPPSWFSEAFQLDLFDILHLADFDVAVTQLSRNLARGGVGLEQPNRFGARLQSISGLAFYSKIVKAYRVGTAFVAVDSGWAVGESFIAVHPGKTLFETNLAIASAIAELAGAVRLADNRLLSMSILPLLSCKGRRDIHIFLESQGIVVEWAREAQDEVEDASAVAHRDEAASERAAEIISQLVSSLHTKPGTTVEIALAGAKASATGTNDLNRISGSIRAERPLPPLNTVILQIAPRVGGAIGVGSSRGGGGYQSGWSVPTQSDVDRDRRHGNRGEEIIYTMELDRLRALGHGDPEALITWTSKENPWADHDIRSVAPDGKPLWIEVKSTTGNDGRIDWSRLEFEKALREGDHYMIWRVYNVETTSPLAKAFENPIELINRGEIRLEISNLRAFIEGK